MFTHAATKEIASIAFKREKGARGTKAVVEGVVEGVMYEVEPGMRYVITERTVRGGKTVRRGWTR